MNIYLSSVFRHALGFVGGALVAKGIVSQEAADQFMGASAEVLLGLSGYAIAQVLSLINKKR